MDPQVEHDDGARNGERGDFDGGKGDVLPRQVLLPGPPGAVEAGEVGVELLRAHHVGERGARLAADALGLSVPALKARLNRGRLMLREALTPHFARGANA